MNHINLLNFKKTIVLFWMTWWLIALWTDVVGALAHFKLLNASWAPDLNYPFLAKSLAMYHVTESWVNVFFAGILLCSALSAFLFVWAAMALKNSKKVWLERANVAFIVSLSYWFVFFLADQLIMNFDLEQNHMVQGGSQLLTFLCIYILPDSTNHMT